MIFLSVSFFKHSKLIAIFCLYILDKKLNQFNKKYIEHWSWDCQQINREDVDMM